MDIEKEKIKIFIIQINYGCEMYVFSKLELLE